MIKIIIVDDEILARVGIQSLLEHCRDISVEGTFGMAQEALDFMRTHETDVVITDIEMPEMNGFEFIQIIQKEHLARGIMILSCYDSFEYAQKAISLGVDSYILKCDINQDTLKEELDSIIVKISRRQRKNPGITSEEELENDDRIKVIGVLKMSGDTDNSQEMLHEKIVLHLLEEIVAKYHMGYLLESYKRSPFVIFQFPEEKQMELKELLEGYVEIIVQNLLLYTNKKYIWALVVNSVIFRRFRIVFRKQRWLQNRGSLMKMAQYSGQKVLNGAQIRPGCCFRMKAFWRKRE